MPSHDCKSLDHKLGMCSNVVHICSCRAVTALATSHRAMAMMILTWNMAVPLPFIISKGCFENTRPIPRLRVAALSDLHLYRLWVEFQNLTNVTHWESNQRLAAGVGFSLKFQSTGATLRPSPNASRCNTLRCAPSFGLWLDSHHTFFLSFTTLVR